MNQAAVMSLELYDKLSVVGKGSYGEVWLVKQKKDNKQVRQEGIDGTYLQNKLQTNTYSNQ